METWTLNLGCDLDKFVNIPTGGHDAIELVFAVSHA